MNAGLNKIFQVLWNKTALISQITKIRQKWLNVRDSQV